MDYDQEKVDKVVMALLYLASSKNGSFIRARKGLDREAMDRLFARGYISDPKANAKSVMLTDLGRARASMLFRQYFGLDDEDDRSVSQPAKHRGRVRRSSAIAGKGYRLMLMLKEVQPTIWRRITVPDISLDRLHAIFQVAMGWRDSHLHLFEINGVSYTDPESARELSMQVADGRMLGSVVPREGIRFRYLYDWGDRWEHDVVVEAILAQAAEQVPLACLAGERRCPPEDVGGYSGYERFLEAFRTPRHPNRAEYMRWLRVCDYKKYDPEAFDRDSSNKLLQRLRNEW